jgi:hypothetical protein
MLLLDISPLPIEQEPDLESFERRLGAWLADRRYPMRLLAYADTFDMRPAVERLERQQQRMLHLRRATQQLLPVLEQLLVTPSAEDELHGVITRSPEADSGSEASSSYSIVPDYAPVIASAVAALDGLPPAQHAAVLALRDGAPIDATAPLEEWLDLADRLESAVWTVPLVHDMEAFYRTLSAGKVRSARYILIVWNPPDVQDREIILSLRMATGCEVERIDRLPPVLRKRVVIEEGEARFRPDEPGQPWLSVLRSYDMTGTLDATLLHPLMGLPDRTIIAIDIETLPQARAMRAAELAYNAARAAIADAQVVDTRSEQKVTDARRVMQELRQQSLHLVQVAVLVEGETPEALAVNRATVRDLLGSALRLEAVSGSQRELIRLFSTTPARDIDAAWARSSLLSHGVGCLFGVIGYYRSNSTQGILFGRDAYRASPLFVELFAGGQAGHMVILGATGSGKTFLMNLISLRAAALEGHRVIWIDSNNNGERLERAFGAGCRRYDIGLDHRVNLLDFAFSPADGSSWLFSQVAYVVSQLGMLLGTTVMQGGEVRDLNPRIFTSEESGMLERALLDVYAGVDPDTSSEEMPILTDLVLALEAIDETEAQALARTLRMRLFGSTRTMESGRTLYDRCFNGPTTLPWNLDPDVVICDLTAIEREAKHMLVFYYGYLIGNIYRYMRSPYRDRSRKTLLALDEFGLASRIEAVGNLAVTLAKVARKYGIALMLSDQNPVTFLDNPSGQAIFENCPIKVLFHMDEDPTQRMGQALPMLQPLHLRFIVDAKPGQCVAIRHGTVTPIVVDSSPRELAVLQGS